MYFWEGDSTNVTGSLHWHDPLDLGEGDRIAYTYKNLIWGWELIIPSEELPYICEIHKEEIYRIIEEERDFMYGLQNTDPANILVGELFQDSAYSSYNYFKTTSYCHQVRQFAVNLASD